MNSKDSSLDSKKRLLSALKAITYRRETNLDSTDSKYYKTNKIYLKNEETV